MLAQRIITAAILLTLVLAALFFLPNLYWGLLLCAGMVLAGFEWGRLAGLSTRPCWGYGLALGCVCLTLLLLERGGAFGTGLLYSTPGRIGYGVCVAFWIAVVPLWLYTRRQVRVPLVMGAVGALVLLPFWHALVFLQPTPGRLLAVMGIVWVADTAAYFAGRAFGRHKLAPHVSPGKTWEGVGGAVLGVTGYWLVLSAIAPAQAGRMPVGLLLPLVLLAVSVYGDLFESWVKRMAGQKDSGTLLPGHGGLLDRIDALTSALPFAALYFAYPELRL